MIIVVCVGIWLLGLGPMAAWMRHDDPREWERDPAVGLVAFWPIVIAVVLVAYVPFALTDRLLKRHDERKAAQKVESDALKRQIADLERELAQSRGPS